MNESEPYHVRSNPRLSQATVLSLLRAQGKIPEMLWTSLGLYGSIIFWAKELQTLFSDVSGISVTLM